MRPWSIVPFLIAAASAPAQTLSPPVIRVIGHGSVKSPPDVATIEYGLRGEGRTSDEAARALAAGRTATDAPLAGRAEVRTGRLAIDEARDKACDGENGDGEDRSRLSTGVCAVVGYIATLRLSARTTPVTEAGTLLGLVGRAGGINPRIEDFALRDPAQAQAAATAAAMADARRQAEAIAKASGVRLGRLRRVEDQSAIPEPPQDIVVTGSRVEAPIAIPLAPEPIATTANLIVEFEIGTAP